MRVWRRALADSAALAMRLSKSARAGVVSGNGEKTEGRRIDGDAKTAGLVV